MNIFSPTVLPYFYKISAVLIVISFITKILRHHFIDKTIIAYIALPDERKERIIRLYRSAISTWRIFLRIMPFVFLVYLALPILLFISPELVSAVPGVDLRQVVLTLGIGLVVGYILIAEDSYYKKKILKAIEKS
ncbi:MAG: hypothetical protein ABI986_12770 [Chloroflexota bacterium]